MLNSFSKVSSSYLEDCTVFSYFLASSYFIFYSLWAVYLLASYDATTQKQIAVI